jgi:hypothetical protein
MPFLSRPHPTSGAIAVPVTHTIDPVKRLAHVTLSGSVTGMDVAAELVALYNDPQWRHGFDTLWDGSGITELLFALDDTAKFRQINRDLAPITGPGIDVVLVVRPVDQAAARVYQTLSRDEVRKSYVVGTMEEARAVLGR